MGCSPHRRRAQMADDRGLSPDHESILTEILDSRSLLEVRKAKDGDFLCPSCVFVAPPNHHLLVGKSGCLKLSSSSATKVNHARPPGRCLFLWRRFIKRAPLPLCSRVAMEMARSGCESPRTRAAWSWRRTGPRRKTFPGQRPRSKPAMWISFCRWMRSVPS